MGFCVGVWVWKKKKNNKIKLCGSGSGCVATSFIHSKKKIS